MKTKTSGFILATILLAVIVIAPASAFADIRQLEINGVETTWTGHNVHEVISATAGETIDIKVDFFANHGRNDVSVFARIRTSGGFDDQTEEFDVLKGLRYTKHLSVQVPHDVDPAETFELIVTVESKIDFGTSRTARLVIHRSNDELQILSVESENNVRAGENLELDVVLKNTGRDEAEDTFVVARIPELGISKKVYFADLFPEDNTGNDEFDSRQRKLFLRIPSDAPAGVYDVEVEAFNSETSTLTTKRIVVLAGGESRVLSASTSKTFAANEEQEYSITIVNTGNNIQIYEFVVESSGLNVELEESIVAVPAGSSKVVRLTAMAPEEGHYEFFVNVHSDGELIQRQAFTANVEGRSAVAGNAAVLLTVVLAIIFVVLLIVLIVLLTRKPEKTEDLGESYY